MCCFLYFKMLNLLALLQGRKRPCSGCLSLGWKLTVETFNSTHELGVSHRSQHLIGPERQRYWDPGPALEHLSFLLRAGEHMWNYVQCELGKAPHTSLKFEICLFLHHSSTSLGRSHRWRPWPHIRGETWMYRDLCNIIKGFFVGPDLRLTWT